MYLNSIYTNNLFNDFDLYAHFIEQADIEYAQLSSGQFKGELRQLFYGPIILSCHSMNQTILQRGKGVEGFTTFLIPGNMNQDFIWRKNRLRGNIIGILKSGMEHNCVTKTDFFGAPVSIENNYLSHMSNFLGYPEFVDQIQRLETIVISHELAFKLHRLIQKNCSELEQNIEEILFEIPKCIIESLTRTDTKGLMFKGESRRRIFNKGQELIHETIENPLSIVQICQKIGVSERNLRYAFKDHSGLSPKQYLQSCRLNEVRRILKSGRFNKIIDVAHRFGYWHTGQFAADYKKLFGELPSDSKR